MQSKDSSYVSVSGYSTQSGIPDFYNLPVIIKHYKLRAKPIKLVIKDFKYSELVKNIYIHHSAVPVPLIVKNKKSYIYKGNGIKIAYPAYLSGVRDNHDGTFTAYVTVFPLKYISKSKTLYSLDSLTFHFELSSTNSYKNNFEKPLYLIVASQAILPGFDSLALWKKMKGYRVRMLKMEDILSTYPGRDAAEQLRNALSEYYQDSGLLYVLLGGDAESVPARVAYAMTCNAGYAADEDSIRADLYFSDLNGSWDKDNDGTFGEVEDSVDLYPDVYVGRVPADNIEEARDFSRKLIQYEQYPSPLAEKALFFAMVLWDGSDYPYTNSGESKDYIDSVYIPPYYATTKLYEALNNETRSSVISAMSGGQGLLNHNGHGWWTGMWLNGSPNWEHLNNQDADTIKMAFSGVLYSIGCWVGAFDKEDAIAEHFTLNPKGPVAMIANSRYGWGSPGNPLYGYSDKFDQHFYKKIFVDSIFHVGMTLAEDKADFAPLSRWKNVYRWHQYEINLFGDPEMEIHTGYSGELMTDIPNHLSNRSKIHFVVYDEKGNYVNYARVSLSYGDSVYTTATTTFNGEGILSTPTYTPDSLLLLIYARNHTTLKRWVYFASEPEIEKLIFTGTDSVNYLFPYDTGKISLYIKNAQNSPISNFFVKFNSSNITLSSDSFFIHDTILRDSTYILRTNFMTGDFNINDSVKITVSTPWNSRKFVHLIKKPHVLIQAKGPDNLVVPGNNTFTITIRNTFPFTLKNTVIYLNPLSSGIIPQTDSFEIPYLNTGDTTSVTFIAYVSDSSISISYIAKNRTFLNDTVNLNYITSVSPSTFDFETGLSGFYTTGNWHITNTRAHSGNHSAWSGTSGHYNNNAHDTLISPWIKTGYTPVLSFYMWYDAAIYGSDGIHVYYFKDNDWTVLDYIGSGGALSDDKGIIQGWSPYTYDLKGLSCDDSTKIMFVLSTDGSDTAEGFYIDDINILSSNYSQNDENYRGKDFAYFASLIGNKLHLLFNLKTPPSFYIFDIQGRKVFEFNFSVTYGGYDFDISHFKPGLYIAMLKSAEKNIIKKVVVER